MPRPTMPLDLANEIADFMKEAQAVDPALGDLFTGSVKPGEAAALFDELGLDIPRPARAPSPAEDEEPDFFAFRPGRADRPAARSRLLKRFNGEDK